MKTLLHWISIALTLQLQAQAPFHIIYDTNDGLPSLEVYDINIDENDKIWLTTDRGVCSYNGYEFKTYTTQDGLSYNTNFLITPDAEGRFWFTAYDGTLSFYEKGHFFPHPLNDQLRGLQKGNWINALFFDEYNHLYFTYNEKASPWVLKQKHYYHIAPSSTSIQSQEISSQDNDSFNAEDLSIIYHPIGEDALIFIEEKNTFALHTLKLSDQQMLFVAHNNYHLAPNQKFALYHKNQNTISKVYESSKIISKIYQDRQNNLFLCTSQGIELFKDGHFDQPSRHYFQQYHTTSIVQDREDNYWISTLQNGIIFVPSFDFNGFFQPGQPAERSKIRSIAKLDNFLIYGTSEGWVKGIDRQMNSFPLIKNRPGHISHIYTQDHTAYTSYSNTIIEKDQKLEALSLPLERMSFSMIQPLKNGDLFCARNSYAVYRNEKEYFQSYTGPSLFQSHFTCLAEDQKGNILAGTLTGLIQIDGVQYHKVKDLAASNPLLKTRISDIKITGQGVAWIATMGNGLLYKSSDTLVQFTSSQGLIGDLLNTIHLEGDSIIWVGTNQGLNRIIYAADSGIVQIKGIDHYNTVNGLPSNVINDIECWNHLVWILTDHGLYHFSPHLSRKNKNSPPVFITQIRVNNKERDSLALLDLPYNQNDIAFEYTGISYRKPKDRPFYRYQFGQDGIKEDWQYTNAQSVYFSNLSPGNYSFRVEAQNNDGLWSRHAAKQQVIIRPHLSQTWWFKSISALSILTSLFLIVRRRNRNMLWKETQKRVLQEADFRVKHAELSVLRKQMNPHFIFNSLNSIQNFIFDQDISKANHFLSSFSKLMRDSLQMSKLDNITIQKEITFLKAYLELEQMRFPKRFDYQFDIDQDIPLYHCLIPPLLLQPLLENAIKHGFKEISYKGMLEIRIHPKVGEEGLLLIEIEDNGIGIDQSNAATSNDHQLHQSMSLEIIQERINIINYQAGNHQASFSITPRAQKAGTLITLTLAAKFITHD